MSEIDDEKHMCDGQELVTYYLYMVFEVSDGQKGMVNVRGDEWIWEMPNW